MECATQHSVQPASLAWPCRQAHLLLKASGEHLQWGRPPPACTTPQQTPGAYKRPAEHQRKVSEHPLVKAHPRHFTVPVHRQLRRAITMMHRFMPAAYRSNPRLPCGDACGGSPPATPAAGRRSACAPPPDPPLLTPKWCGIRSFYNLSPQANLHAMVQHVRFGTLL